MARKILNTIDRIVGYVLVALFSVSVLTLFYQVIMRYVFNKSTIWAEELAIFCIIWMCSLGCALAFRRYKHITITTLSDMIPWKIRRYIEVINYLLIIFFLCYAFRYSWVLVQQQWEVYTTGFRMRIGVLYLSIPISAVLMICSIIECIYDRIKNFNIDTSKAADPID